MPLTPHCQPRLWKWPAAMSVLIEQVHAQGIQWALYWVYRRKTVPIECLRHVLVLQVHSWQRACSLPAPCAARARGCCCCAPDRPACTPACVPAPRRTTRLYTAPMAACVNQHYAFLTVRTPRPCGPDAAPRPGLRGARSAATHAASGKAGHSAHSHARCQRCWLAAALPGHGR